MKKLMILALALISTQISAGVFTGVSNVVGSATQTFVDAADTAGSVVTLGGYQGTHTLPRYVGPNEVQPMVYATDVDYVQ